MTKKSTGSGLYRNTLSYFGGLLALVSLILILFWLLVMFSIEKPSPYIGIVTYMLLPGVFTLGLLIFLYGTRRESLRRRRLGTTEALPYPLLDLNDPRQRKRFGFILVFGSLFAILLSFVGYNAFLFTESVTFCGEVCHSVMEPEHTAYQHSPHARVSCVDCHVGEGASWYVKSKLSGVRQVFAVMLGTYSKPIKTPIADLRPARETCEECHWPSKFYGAQLIQIPFFRYDEPNTSDQISFMVKTGGGNVGYGSNSGIHWHMIIANTISFVARDYQQQDIPWIQARSADGRERVYVSLDKPASKDELARLSRHNVDCIDCHNRPTHIFRPPDRAIDELMNSGAIPKDLPWIKKVTADALMSTYPDKATALKQLQDQIKGFYARQYPTLATSRAGDIQHTTEIATALYSRSVFPEMKVNWSTYPDNIGQRNWPGCFRCHDGRHATSDGRVLTNSCIACHTMPQRGPLESLGALPPITDISWHPFSLQGKHAEILCHRCHAAGQRPSGECAGCHQHDRAQPMGEMACGDCHLTPGARSPQADCQTCHEKLGGLHTEDTHAEAACVDCHQPHGWRVTQRETCLGCHDGMAKHNAPDFCGDCHEFTGQ